MKNYIYKENTFSSVAELKKYLWENERRTFGTLNDAIIKMLNLEVVEVEKSVTASKARILTDEERLEIRKRQVREIRDEKLQKTDCMMLADYPISEEEKENLIAYRQHLRDVPKQEGFPDNVDWGSYE